MMDDGDGLTGGEGTQASGTLEALSRLLRSKSVPEHRHSVWYYFGGLTLFLLIIMVASGVLLSVYYEPGGGPALAPDGTPLAAAVVRRSVTWGERRYEAGEVIALPLNTARGEVIAAGPLEGAVATVREKITGAPLRPSAAWVSVEGRIMHDVEFGALVRSIHVYAANLLVAAVALHMFSAFFMRAYRRPRRMLWVTGVVLFGLILGFGFTGYLLPWNQLAYFATRIGVSLPENGLPIAGPLAAAVLRGGSDVGATTLTRMYAMHVVGLPLATLIVAGLHILLLQIYGLAPATAAKRRGGAIVAGAIGLVAVGSLVAGVIVAGEFDTSSPLILLPLAALPVVGAYLMSALAGVLNAVPEDASPTAPAETGPARTPFYANYIYRDYLAWLLAFGIVITLAIAAPWDEGGAFGMPVDLTKPLVTPEGIHPEWYFMWAFQLLRGMPAAAAIGLILVTGCVWFAIPWLDRRREGRRNPAFIALGIAIISALAALTIWGYASLAAS